jgi:hypothetical protein
MLMFVYFGSANSVSEYYQRNAMHLSTTASSLTASVLNSLQLLALVYDSADFYSNQVKCSVLTYLSLWGG